MLTEGKDGVAIVCDKCGSRMHLAAHPMQAAAQRMPSGWMRVETESHTCPLCSRVTMATFRTR